MFGFGSGRRIRCSTGVSNSTPSSPRSASQRTSAVSLKSIYSLIAARAEEASLGCIPPHRSLSETYAELRRSAASELHPRKAWLKRLLAIQDVAGLSRFLEIKGRLNQRASSCPSCEQPLLTRKTHKGKPVVCTICHETTCGGCCTKVSLLETLSGSSHSSEMALRAVCCCVDCRRFVQECHWRSRASRSLLPPDSRQLDMVFSEVSDIHTWLWKQRAQLEGLLRLVGDTADTCSEESLLMLPPDLPAVISDVCSVLSTCIERLHKLLDECKSISCGSNCAMNRRVQTSLCQYIVLILQKHRSKLTLSQVRLRELKRRHPLFMKETTVPRRARASSACEGDGVLLPLTATATNRPLRPPLTDIVGGQTNARGFSNTSPSPLRNVLSESDPESEVAAADIRPSDGRRYKKDSPPPTILEHEPLRDLAVLRNRNTSYSCTLSTTETDADQQRWQVVDDGNTTTSGVRRFYSLLPSSRRGELRSASLDHRISRPPLPKQT